MNNPISVSGTKLAKNTDLQGCIDTLKAAGYDTADFWLCKYCYGDNAPMCRPDWRDWVQDTARRFEEAMITVGQAHAHWDHSFQIHEDFSFDPPQPVIYNNIEAAALLGCRHLIFHPIQRWFRMPEESMRQRVIEINAAWFRFLLPTAEQYGVELHIENLFDHKHVQQAGDPLFPFGTAADILALVGAIDHPLIKICLDTGHANINAQDVPATIRAYGKRLGSLHLNDNYGKIGPIYEDLHLFPSYGRLPWKAIFEALAEIGYDGTLNMEPGGELDKLPYELRVIQLRAAREAVETMQRLYTK